MVITQSLLTTRLTSVMTSNVSCSTSVVFLTHGSFRSSWLPEVPSGSGGGSPQSQNSLQVSLSCAIHLSAEGDPPQVHYPVHGACDSPHCGPPQGSHSSHCTSMQASLFCWLQSSCGVKTTVAPSSQQSVEPVVGSGVISHENLPPFSLQQYSHSKFGVFSTSHSACSSSSGPVGRLSGSGHSQKVGWQGVCNTHFQTADGGYPPGLTPSESLSCMHGSVAISSVQPLSIKQSTSQSGSIP